MNDVLLQNQIEMNKEIGRVAEIVKRHDEETFPRMMKVLDEQTKALTRMESKQNKDITQFNQANEELKKRVDPIEQDFLQRQKAKENILGKFSWIFWEIMKVVSVALVLYVLIKVMPSLKPFI